MLFKIHNSRRQHGLTLLEVMVALVVFSIGLLGLAGMTMSGISSTNSAQHRTQAVFLAYDILDRMRANPTAAAGNSYGTLLATKAKTLKPATKTYCYTKTCNANELANADLFEWKSMLESALPTGQGEIEHITLASGTVDIYEITVQWTEPDGSTTSYVLRSEL